MTGSTQETVGDIHNYDCVYFVQNISDKRYHVASFVQSCTCFTLDLKYGDKRKDQAITDRGGFSGLDLIT